MGLDRLDDSTGCIAALNRFVARSMDKCQPFFKILKKEFEWTAEGERAFNELKEYLQSPPLLSRAKPGETLYLYVAVSPHAVNSVLIPDNKGIQHPVYYTSRALRGPKIRYPRIEKVAFVVVIAAWS